MAESKTVTVDKNDLHTLIAVAEALINKIRYDYDVRLVHARTAASYEQRCRRCGFMIMPDDMIIRVDRVDTYRTDWVHEKCPTPRISK